MRHKAFSNIYSLGDVCSTPNAKTAAAARKQAPVVAENIAIDMGLIKRKGNAVYDGYGSCPLTVERGKIILAEFGYGGKLMRILPPIYWKAMLKGHEWMAKPKISA
jgi:sulfide:quinone oxidoreductase